MILFRQSPRRCWLVGHRGAMGRAPENTFVSFETGLRMGADLVECDVHLSKDKKCVVMHDESLERTTNGAGLIRDTLSSKIRKLDAGSWLSKKFRAEKVPMLDGLLSWANRARTAQGFPLNVAIEIKNEPVRYFEIEKRVVETVRKAGMRDRVILISFDHGVVKRAKRLDPQIAAGMLYSRPLENPVQRAKEMNADAIFPRRNLVTKSLVSLAHKAGLCVATWTVNEISEMKKLVRCGVDAIATNYPDLLNNLLNPKS